jgi:uncharacterized protein YecE (DUF72 family)
MGGRILVGTASWTDRSLIECGRFYPPDATTAEARLHHYASVFPLVEVDSSYYGMPSERNSALWVERTPDDFTFDIKSFSLFTQHPTRPASLPRDIRERLPAAAKAKKNLYAGDVPDELMNELWTRFGEALLPLDSAGKLGVVLFQFPPWFLPGRESFAYLDRLQERLPQYTPAVEFRHPLWLDERHAAETLAFLSERGLPYVCVDEPQGTPSSVPPVVAATARVSVVRFHGRNAAAWGKRGVEVAEKYDWLYDEDDLREWTPSIGRLADESAVVHVLMNNCREDKAVVNARQIARLLREAGETVPEP